MYIQSRMYPYMVEYLGTLLLIGAVAFTGNPVMIVAALAIALGLGSKVSGGHFNPAISLWAWLAGKIPTHTLGMYVGAQTAAATTIWILQFVL